MPRIEIGITLPLLDSEAGDLRAQAHHVEALGFDSVWIPDLVVGDGTPALDCTVAAAVALVATGRVGVGFGVLALPLRPVVQVAAQVAALQHLSGDRLFLGVGAGGFPGSPFWQAMDAPPAADRGRRMDEALAVLPGLVAGKATPLDRDTVTLAPPATVPPILVGGTSDAAIRRAVRYGDAWFPSLLDPDGLRRRAERLHEAAAQHGRAVPGITVGGHVVVGDDASARSAHDDLVRSLVDDHGMPADAAAGIPLTAGSPAQLAERFAAFAEAGAERLVVSIDGDGWMRRTELVADAVALLDH